MNRILGLVAIALALTVLVVWLGGSAAGLDEDDAARLLYFALFATMVGSGILARNSLNASLKQGAIWVAILAALSGAYVVRDDAAAFGSRLMAALRPGSVATVTGADGKTEVIVHKGGNGHFEADVTIDGVILPMMVDTGASGIALTWEDARKLGFRPETLRFDTNVSTANGTVKVAIVRIGSVGIGPISRKNLTAGVMPQGALGQSLLGMNFLGSLSAVTLAGDEMRLSD